MATLNKNHNSVILFTHALNAYLVFQLHSNIKSLINCYLLNEKLPNIKEILLFANEFNLISKFSCPIEDMVRPLN